MVLLAPIHNTCSEAVSVASTGESIPSSAYTVNSGSLDIYAGRRSSDFAVRLEDSCPWQRGDSLAVSYIVERSSTGTGDWQPIGSVNAPLTSYTDHDLTADTQYFYRVINDDAVGPPSPIAQASATTMSTGPTSTTPTNLSSSQLSGDAPGIKTFTLIGGFVVDAAAVNSAPPSAFIGNFSNTITSPTNSSENWS